MTENKIQHIIESIGTKKNHAIPILQAIQDEYKYLPEDALRQVVNATEITHADILGIASFYSQFRLEPVGDHIIKVCVGTACHVKGADLVHDAFQRDLKLEGGKTTDKSGKYTLEKVSCLGCCTLAPVVQVDNVTYGHVAPNEISKVIDNFENFKGDKSKKHYRKSDGTEYEGEIRIGLGSCCVASGSDEIRKSIETTVGEKDLNVQLKHVGCVGMCHQVPLVEIVEKDKEPKMYSKVTPQDVQLIIDKHFTSGNIFNRLRYKFLDVVEKIQTDEHWEGIKRYELDVRENRVESFLGNQVPIATEHRGVISPADIDEYIHKGGFRAFKKALNNMSSEEIINEVIASDIRGRGGAGFPTGKKWEIVSKVEGEEKYLICNGDEGDPGAFMDRMLLESYPYRIIEGILIAAKATNINKGYFYIRAEYPLAVSRILKAIEACKQKGYLGENILGSGFSFELGLYQGAGAFVCGEETALIASMEGKRGFPVIRPPFPAQKGLFDKPTLVNNTETFAQISYIINNGSDKFNSIGVQGSHGTKVFALAGKVERGGLIEVPMGITIREVVEEIGGGVANNRKFKAVQIGGPSGGCIPHWLSDTPIDFDSLSKVGAMMGSGGLVVLDETDCMVDIAKYFLSFTQDESCGKCTFCRIGTRRMLDILERLTAGKARKNDLDELEKLAEWTNKGSLCGLGKTAPNPVLSTLKYFKDEYEAHLKGHCPTGKCKELITYTVNESCIGCTKCAQKCPTDAIPFTPHEVHEINQELCIQCDTCRQVCPVDAIDVK